MRAVTVVPHSADSLNVEDHPEPTAGDGPVVLQMLAVGVCGTDRRILAGAHGEAPIGRHRLVLGHESVGRVVEAPSGSDLHPGDLVVPLVRRADPVPCPNCAADHPDMCRNGLYTEHGIKGADGFLRERIRTTPDRLVTVEGTLGLSAVLVEPASIAAKAWDGVRWAWDRTPAQPRSVLITGAGPVGLLAALLVRQDRPELDLHLLDRTGGVKCDLARSLGATYHRGRIEDLDLTPDAVLECTGAAEVIAAVITRVAADGVVCLVGLPPRGSRLSVDFGEIDRRLVLGNSVVLGTVSSYRDHYRAAAAALARADQDWLGRLISRRVGLDDARSAFDVQPFDVKSAIVIEDHA